LVTGGPARRFLDEDDKEVEDKEVSSVTVVEGAPDAAAAAAADDIWFGKKWKAQQPALVQARPR
jgi:hypothetical protein